MTATFLWPWRRAGASWLAFAGVHDQEHLVGLLRVDVQPWRLSVFSLPKNENQPPQFVATYDNPSGDLAAATAALTLLLPVVPLTIAQARALRKAAKKERAKAAAARRSAPPTMKGPPIAEMAPIPEGWRVFTVGRPFSWAFVRDVDGQPRIWVIRVRKERRVWKARCFTANAPLAAARAELLGRRLQEVYSPALDALCQALAVGFTVSCDCPIPHLGASRIHTAECSTAGGSNGIRH